MTGIVDLPDRRSGRLRGYDYNSNGAYFITACTANRKMLFGKIVGAIHESPATMALNANGFIVKSVIESMKNRFQYIYIENFIIMPNHVHLLISIDGERAIRESPLPMKRSNLSKMIGYMKMNASKKIRVNKTNTEKIWQRSYYDRIVRNEEEYKKIWEYININPEKWNQDRYFHQEG